MTQSGLGDREYAILRSRGYNNETMQKKPIYVLVQCLENPHLENP